MEKLMSQNWEYVRNSRIRLTILLKVVIIESDIYKLSYYVLTSGLGKILIKTEAFL